MDSRFKYRRKIIYRQYKKSVGEILKSLCEYSRIRSSDKNIQ
ncbi:hypothetical protein [Leptotrichia massiliensis]|nr:hypothetical protein [Leptotrichia massiliensis]